MKKVIIATMILVTAASMAYMVSKYEDKCNDAKKITITYEGTRYVEVEETEVIVETEVVEETEATSAQKISKTAQKAPVQTAAPVETAPAPVETEVAPVESAPAPVETQPAPVETQPAPVETQPVKTYTVCPICNGMGVVYEQSQYYDALLGWQFMTYTYCCGGCGGSGCI